MLKGFKLALLSCLVAVPVFHQANADELKIGYVNIERVFREAPAAINASKKMAQEFDGRRQELLRAEDDLRLRQAALSEKGMGLSDSQRRAKEAELTEMSVSLQRKQQVFQEDVKIRQREESSAIVEKANKVILEMAESEHWDLILQEAITVSKRIDITDIVIKKLSGD